MATRRFDIDPATIVSRETVTVTAEGAPGEAPRLVRTFEIIRTTQRDPYDTATDEALEAREARVRAAGDDFTGEDRRDAKLSIVGGEPEGFDSLSELLNSLPSKATMVNHDPPISRDPDSERVEEERMTVRVRTFLWAAKRINDNDYHIIIGNAPAKPTRFMNIEVSGLPPRDHPDFETLRDVRRAFEDVTRDSEHGVPNTRGYDFYRPPFPVIVEGSLLFDIAHANDGGPGPKDAKPRTAWEIHPVSALEFLDTGGGGEEAPAAPGAEIDPSTIVGTSEMASPGGVRRTVVRTTQKDAYDEPEKKD